MSRLYFVIDTDHYAGNFERPMCAFMTGRVGECGVGKDRAKQFYDDHPDLDEDEPLGGLISGESDENGCWRPVKIYPTPGWFNNGHGGCFRENEEDVVERAIETRDEAIMSYANDTIRRCYADKDYANNRADEYIKENIGKPLVRYPAYYSVAICLDHEPTEEQTEFLKKRAKLFARRHTSFDGKADPIEITGFRLIRVREVEERIW